MISRVFAATAGAWIRPLRTICHNSELLLLLPRTRPPNVCTMAPPDDEYDAQWHEHWRAGIEPGQARDDSTLSVMPLHAWLD